MDWIGLGRYGPTDPCSPTLTLSEYVSTEANPDYGVRYYARGAVTNLQQGYISLLCPGLSLMHSAGCSLMLCIS